MKVAGDKFNQDIISFIRGEHKLLIGEKTAENLKIAIGSVLPLPAPLEAAIRGRDLVTGLPREVIVTDTDIREAMAKSIRVIAEATKEVIEKTPPELISDMMHRGIALVGGGSFLRGIDKVLEVETKIPVHIAEDPLTAVVRGCGVILEDLNNLTDVLVEHEEELPPI